MGGFDIYCYKCGVPVCDLRNYKKNIKLSSKLLEELRLGYFKTKDGIIHNVKDFDTGFSSTFINTDTNIVENVYKLLDNSNNPENSLCHRNCSKYLHSINDDNIYMLFKKYKIQNQWFNYKQYINKVLPEQILNKKILNISIKPVKRIKEYSKKSDVIVKSEDTNYIKNPLSGKWVKKDGVIGKILSKCKVYTS